MKNPKIAARYVLVYMICMVVNAGFSFGQKYMEQAIPYRRSATLPTSDGYVSVHFIRKQQIGKAHPTRIYYSYYRDSIYATQGGYHGYLLHGQYIERYAHKGLKAMGQYKYGVRTGKWQFWDNSGVLRRVVYWRAGHETGKYSRYSETGDLEQRGGWLIRLRERLRKWKGK